MCPTVQLNDSKRGKAGGKPKYHYQRTAHHHLHEFPVSFTSWVSDFRRLLETQFTCNTGATFCILAAIGGRILSYIGSFGPGIHYIPAVYNACVLRCHTRQSLVAPSAFLIYWKNWGPTISKKVKTPEATLFPPSECPRKRLEQTYFCCGPCQSCYQQ